MKHNKSPSVCWEGDQENLRRLSSLVHCSLKESYYCVGLDNIAGLMLPRDYGVFEWETLNLNTIYVWEKVSEEESEIQDEGMHSFCATKLSNKYFDMNNM